MNRFLVVMLIACLVVSGCGLWMNSEYSKRLDETVAWSTEVSARAEAGNLSPDEAKQALKTNAALWRLFKEARDGVKPAVTP